MEYLFEKERKVILKDLMANILLILLFTFIYTKFYKFVIDYDLDYILSISNVIAIIFYIWKVLSIIIYAFMYKKPKYFYTDLYKFIDYNYIKKELATIIVSTFAYFLITLMIFSIGSSFLNYNIEDKLKIVYIITISLIIIQELLKFILFIKKIKIDVNVFNTYTKTNYSSNTQSTYSNKNQFNNSYEKKVYEPQKPATPMYYEVLGFDKEPDKFDDIKLSYRRLVKVNHPDKGGDIETMQKINEAYEEAKNKFGK